MDPRFSGCVVICFTDGRVQDIVGVRFIEPDITGLMNQAPTLRHSLFAGMTKNGVLHNPMVEQTMELKEIKKLWRENGFRPKKRMGQNFLIDENVRGNIIKAFSLSGSETVVEIGSGFGVMTFEVASGCKKLYAVEKDATICQIMEPYFSKAGNIELINGDILQFEIDNVTGQNREILVFGNIPYYISTPVIEHMIDNKKRIKALYLVMQEELADRIVSPPHSKVYGSLSCFVQYHTAARKLFKISRNCFFPTPQVGSCLLELKMLKSPSVEVKDEALMFKIIRTAFGQRRKKMINPLSGPRFETMDKASWIEIFRECQIEVSSRAENLSLPEYALLSDAVTERT